MRVSWVLGAVLSCTIWCASPLPAAWCDFRSQADSYGSPSHGGGLADGFRFPGRCPAVCDSGCVLVPWSDGGCSCGDCLPGGVAACAPGGLFPQRGRLQVYGWLDGGYQGNTSSPDSKFNGPYNAVDRANEPMFNQGCLIGEFGLPADGSWGVGGRLDVLYGEDYLLAQSRGFERRPDGSPHWNGHEYYGLALPQAYVELGSTDLSLKIGHFYTPIGYEGVPAPANFFYSKSYSYQFAGPFTHWGGLLTWSLSPNWEAQLGLHNGWNALDRVSDRMGVLAGIKYTHPSDEWWSSFAITTGDDDNDVAGLPGVVPDFTNRTRYSWIVLLSLTERLDYVFHHWLGLQEAGAPGNNQADWYGLDHYVYYTINDCWKAGIRYEWCRDEEGTRIGLARPSNPNVPPLAGDIYSISLGLNWTPLRSLVLRPEVRWDFYDGDAARQPFEDGDKDNQLLVGCDGILHF